ncbi:hypothetical protein [Streptomyces sp. NPDC051677]|uniref:hypothetical protein n=1 Tax=Streptomyces sp. NPDC051677 TaxID=3365669 RepID=UPI0037D0C526
MSEDELVDEAGGQVKECFDFGEGQDLPEFEYGLLKGKSVDALDFRSKRGYKLVMTVRSGVFRTAVVSESGGAVPDPGTVG